MDAIVLAAGQGTRLKSKTPKVLHPLFGKALLQRVLETVAQISVRNTYLVLGHGRAQVQAEVESWNLPGSLFPVVQEPQLGTGHAVLQVKKVLPEASAGDVLVLTGDAPLLRPETLSHLAQVHQASGQALTLLVADLENPTGYGRVLTQNGQIHKIVEEKDAGSAEKQVKTVNTGVYCLDWQKIAPLLDQLSTDNAQGEFYLTDVLAMAVAKGLPVKGVWLEDPSEMLGVNDRADLALCHQRLNQRSLSRLMAAGVTVVDPAQTQIAPEVQIGADTVIYPGCYLEGTMTLGSDCIIGPNTSLWGAVAVGDGTEIRHSRVKDSVIGANTTIGPFAHVRDGADISDFVRIGNFVEVKNSRINHHTNAAHLAYLGDADLGSEVNMGAGSITANYDPIRGEKHRTRIEDGVKVGCNAVLVAPITVAERACVAAGSVVTQDVPAWSLAIARPRQTDVADWVARITQSKAETTKSS